MQPHLKLIEEQLGFIHIPDSYRNEDATPEVTQSLADKMGVRPCDIQWFLTGVGVEAMVKPVELRK